MTGIGSTPCRHVAENVRDLKTWAGGDMRTSALGGRRRLFFSGSVLARAHDRAGWAGGNAGVERGRFEVGVSQQELNVTTSTSAPDRCVA